MDRMLYVSMSGAKQLMQAQAVNNNNLANVSTHGFREDLHQLRSMPVFGDGYPARAYAMTERPAYNFNPGPLETTGRQLDVAIKGPGWIAVQLPDGSEGLTRAGDLRMVDGNRLVTADGMAVLGNTGPIALPPASSMEIGADGSISMVPVGQSAAAMAIVDRIKLVNPPAQGLVKGEDGYFRVNNGAPSDPAATVQLISGTLEGSNVSAVSALVDMIAYARQYDLQVKMMRTAEETDQSSTQLIRMG